MAVRLRNQRMLRVQYTRLESGCLHPQADRVISRPGPEIGARRFDQCYRRQEVNRRRRVEDAGKQTRSDPMEAVRPGKSRSDSPEICSRET